MKYPKIETLYKRNESFKVDPTQIRLPEFTLINKWLITEKIDGTNIRIFLNEEGEVRFGGRIDRAQLPTHLLNHLQDTFTSERMQGVFNRDDDGDFPSVILFGEGYGEKIQSGGWYRKGVFFRLFDVRIGEWWMNWDSIVDIACDLGIYTVPFLGMYDTIPTCKAELEDITGPSIVALEEYGQEGRLPEGIVARTDPLLFTRRDDRVMWKLKYKDF